MNTPVPWLVEVLFLFSSSISIFYRILATAPLLASIYLLFLFAYAIGCIKLRPPHPIMFHSPLCIFNLFIFCTLLLGKFANAQNATLTTTTFRPIFTVPASADVGMYLLPECRSSLRTTLHITIELSFHRVISIEEGILTPNPCDRCKLDT